MAYMHNKTFHIIKSTATPDLNDYFEVDDLIAPAIQVLNCKGYITEFCCSGHPFELDKSDIPDIREYYRDFSRISGIPYYSNIVFKNGISLPSIPPGFFMLDKSDPSIEWSEGYKPELDKRVFLERHFQENDIYNAFREILEAMEQLYEWALSLPDLNSCC